MTRKRPSARDPNAGPDSHYEYVPFDDERYLTVFSPEVTRHQSLTESLTQTEPALRVNIPEGSHYGSRMAFITSEQWNTQCEDLHARYWIYLPSEFHFTQQLKLPFIGNQRTQGGGGRVSDGTGGWSARVALHENRDAAPGLEFYTYHAEMEGPYGDHDEWGVELPTAEWARIDFYVRVNTPGEHDGTIRGWLNGDLGHEVDELVFRERGYDELGIDEFTFDVYHGGNEAASTETFLAFNDLELYANQGASP
ncbi:polysaccharide lyase [Natrialbaceae archaeon GCM10025810]|uniref:polysaccharide lyase n=1 Tax=Halovalidus salilacus TaxID=3075124 RepID=UPI00361F3861